jgi:hypothetical protein
MAARAPVLRPIPMFARHRAMFRLRRLVRRYWRALQDNELTGLDGTIL